MGPTIQENNALDFAMEFTKSTKAKTCDKRKTCERNSKEQEVELFQLGRMNFKKVYKNLKTVYPDIDKISKLSHFRILWKRIVNNNSETPSKYD